MPGLPTELHNRCRTTLLKCSEFDTNAALQAVFVTDELRPFRDRLPTALSKSARVDACLAFLLEQQITGGHPALPAFLLALHGRYQPGDALRDEIGALIEKIHSRLVSPDQHTESITPSPTSISKSTQIRDINVATDGGTIITGSQHVIVERVHKPNRSDPDDGEL